MKVEEKDKRESAPVPGHCNPELAKEEEGGRRNW